MFLIFLGLCKLGAGLEPQNNIGFDSSTRHLYSNDNNNNDDGNENCVKDCKESRLGGRICSTFIESTRCT
jgi:hypothetical protein